MAEEKESSFRVTDRRKFNPDGTPRDFGDEAEVTPADTAPPAGTPPASAPPEAAPEPASDNVVSFPGDAARRREAEAPPVSATPTEAPTLAPPEPLRAEPRAAQSADDARAAQAKATALAAEQAYNQTRGPQSPHLPEASFLTLIDMFAADGGRTPVDLEAARHWVDMLGMLDQKTQGHLTDEEASVLENVLAYLRMQFVAASRKR